MKSDTLTNETGDIEVRNGGRGRDIASGGNEWFGEEAVGAQVVEFRQFQAGKAEFRQFKRRF